VFTHLKLAEFEPTLPESLPHLWFDALLRNLDYGRLYGSSADERILFAFRCLSSASKNCRFSQASFGCHRWRKAYRNWQKHWV